MLCKIELMFYKFIIIIVECIYNILNALDALNIPCRYTYIKYPEPVCLNS